MLLMASAKKTIGVLILLFLTSLVAYPGAAFGFKDVSDLSGSPSAQAEETYENDVPFPQQWDAGFVGRGGGWSDVAYGNGKYVALRSDGKIATSSNGKRWNLVKESSEIGQWTSISAGNGVFVALAFGQDKALFSDDGVNWQEEKAKPGSWSDIAYGNGHFVAVSAQGGIQASVDGKNWSWRMRDSGSLGRPGWRSVDYYQGKFAAVASGGKGRVAFSDNGWDWKVEDFNEASLSAVAVGDSATVVGSYSGELFVSENGRDWQKSANRYAGAVEDIIYDSGSFIAIVRPRELFFSNVIVYSNDGINWQGTDGVGGRLRSLTRGDHGVAAVGDMSSDFGMYALACCSADELFVESITSPPAGVDWQSQPLESESLWKGITFGNGLFVAASNDGESMSSVDGTSWQSSDMPSAPGPYSLAFGGERFVGVVFGSQDTVYSDDGINWQTSRMEPARGDRPQSVSAWSDVVYGQNQFVAVSTGGGIQTSPDGVTWKRRINSGKIGGTTLRGVAFGNGKFLAIGSSGKEQAYISSNGASWEPLDVPAGHWQEIAFGNGRFVAVGYDGQIIQSSDGINWENVYSDDTVGFHSVIFAGGQFIVSANDEINLGSAKNPYYVARMLSSSDGINWFQRAANLRSFPEVAFGNDRFVSISTARRSDNLVAVSEGAALGEAPLTDPAEVTSPEGADPSASGGESVSSEPSSEQEEIIYQQAASSRADSQKDRAPEAFQALGNQLSSPPVLQEAWLQLAQNFSVLRRGKDDLEIDAAGQEYVFITSLSDFIQR